MLCRNPVKVRDWIDAVFVKKRFYSADAQYAPSVSRTQVSPSLPCSARQACMDAGACDPQSCLLLGSPWAALGQRPPATASTGSGCRSRLPAMAPLQARHVPSYLCQTRTAVLLLSFVWHKVDRSGWLLQAAAAHVEAGRAASEAGSLIDLDLGQAPSTQSHPPGNLLNSSIVADASHAGAAASGSNWSSFADVSGENLHRAPCTAHG